MPGPQVTVAVEGPTDQAVVQRLLAGLGLEMGRVLICNGKGKLDKRLDAYNQAARYAPWLVLRDLDTDAECAPRLVAELLPEPSQQMCFRIAVRAVECWLLADSEAMASFLGVAVQSLPLSPDLLAQPKAELLQIAGKARHRSVRKDLLPMEGMTAPVGPAYTARVIEFATLHWRPEVAAERSPSLAGCIRSLCRLR